MAVTSLITIVSPVFGSNEPIFAFGGGMGCLAETGSSSEFAKVRHKSGARAESRHDRRVKTITPRTPQRPPPVTLCGIFARLRQIKATNFRCMTGTMRKSPATAGSLSGYYPGSGPINSTAMAVKPPSQKGPFPRADGLSDCMMGSIRAGEHRKTPSASMLWSKSASDSMC